MLERSDSVIPHPLIEVRNVARKVEDLEVEINELKQHRNTRDVVTYSLVFAVLLSWGAILALLAQHV